jgi:acetyltransferase-like isoleucine patch superfamily enzyme
MLKKIINLLVSFFMPIIIIRLFFKIYNNFIINRLNIACTEEIKSKLKKCGYDCRIRWPSTFLCANNIELGNGIRIGRNSFLYGSGGIVIGDNTQISRNVTIYSGNHDYNGKTIPYDNKVINKPVLIGKSVWIGMNVCIIPGITIGDGAIIGMGTVVTHNVEEGQIIGCQHERLIKTRNMDHFRELLIKQMLFSLEYPND